MRQTTVILCGHVDHGKTTLAEMLEKKAASPRGRTERAAFVHLQEEGRIVTLVDLPGHAQFLHVTAAGAFRADAALAAVDACEGIMPQTREHFTLLTALGIDTLLLALTRCDRLPYEKRQKRLKELEARIRHDFPTLRIHFATAVSLSEPNSYTPLRKALFALPPRQPSESPLFRFRIDQLFTKKGIGTVVTGEPEGEAVTEGESLFVAEAPHRPVQVRGIQRYGRPAERAEPGDRAALRLGKLPAKIAKTLRPGMTLCKEGGLLTPSDTLEGKVTLFRPLPPHGSRVTLLLGFGRYDATMLDLGDGWIGVRLERPATASFRDMAILLHGGRLIAALHILSPLRDPLRRPAKRTLLRKLFDGDFAAAFALLADNHPRGLRLDNAAQRFGLRDEEVTPIAESLAHALYDPKTRLLISEKQLWKHLQKIENIIEKKSVSVFSEKSLAASFGIPLFIAEKLLETLQKKNLLQKKNGLYFHQSSSLEKEIETAKKNLFESLEKASENPPAPNDLFDRLGLPRELGKRLLRELAAEGLVIELGEGRFATNPTAKKMQERMTELLEAEGFLDIAGMKKHFGFGRKNAVAWLMFLDTLPYIKNENNRRVLK